MLYQGSDEQGRMTTVTLESYCAPQRKMQWSQTNVSNEGSGIEESPRRSSCMLRGKSVNEESSKSEESFRSARPRQIPVCRKPDTDICRTGRSKEVRPTCVTRARSSVRSPAKQSENIIQTLTPRPKSSDSCQTEKSVCARTEEKRIPCTGRAKSVAVPCRKPSEVREVCPSRANMIAKKKEPCPSFSGLCQNKVGTARVVCPSRTKLRQERPTRVPCVGRGSRKVGTVGPGRCSRPTQDTCVKPPQETCVRPAQETCVRPAQETCIRPLTSTLKYDDRTEGEYAHKDTEKCVRIEAQPCTPSCTSTEDERRRSRSIETIPVKKISVSSDDQKRPSATSDRTKITEVLTEDKGTNASEKARISECVDADRAPDESADEKRLSGTDEPRLSGSLKQERRPSFLAEMAEMRRASAESKDDAKLDSASERRMSAGCKEGVKPKTSLEYKIKRILITEMSEEGTFKAKPNEETTSEVSKTKEASALSEEEMNQAEEMPESSEEETNEVKNVPVISEEEANGVNRKSVVSEEETNEVKGTPMILEETNEVKRISVISEEETNEIKRTSIVSEEEMNEVKRISVISKEEEKSTVPSDTAEARKVSTTSKEEKRPSTADTFETKKVCVTPKDEKKPHAKETPEIKNVGVKYIERRVPCVPDSSRISGASKEDRKPSYLQQVPRISDTSGEERLSSVDLDIPKFPRIPTDHRKSSDTSEAIYPSESYTEDRKESGTTEASESKDFSAAPAETRPDTTSLDAGVKTVPITAIEEQRQYTKETETDTLYKEDKVQQTSETIQTSIAVKRISALSQTSRISDNGAPGEERKPSVASKVSDARKLSSNEERRSSETSPDGSGERSPKKVSISDDTQTILEVNKLPDYQRTRKDSRLINTRDSLTLGHPIDFGMQRRDVSPEAMEEIDDQRSYGERSSLDPREDRKSYEDAMRRLMQLHADREDSMTRASTDVEGISIAESTIDDEADESKRTISVCSTATSTGIHRPAQCAPNKKSETKETILYSVYNIKKDEKKKVSISQKDDAKEKSQPAGITTVACVKP